MTAKQVESELKKHGSQKKSEASAWFFKTAKGQYGYGDKFIGVSVPEQRKIAQEYKNLPLSEIQKLLNSKLHECRLTSLIILVNQFKNGGEKTRKEIYKFYLANTKNINNWDLVDSSASQIVGAYLLDKDRKLLYKFVSSPSMWERRIAVIATFAFIAQSDFEDSIKLAKLLMNDKEDLMHKAVGWMLREMGKKDIKTLDNFLIENAHLLPRTTLRYAIERYPETKRKKYLAIKKV